MTTYVVLLLCIQVGLLQSVVSQCTSRAAVADGPGLAGPYGFGAPALAAPCGMAGPYGLPGPYGFAGPYGLAGSPMAYDGIPGVGLPGGFPSAGYGAGLAPYGGSGEGNVAVAGELPVGGTTAVAGQVPIMGAVNFGGSVPAAGSVSISGQCACGCNTPLYY